MAGYTIPKDKGTNCLSDSALGEENGGRHRKGLSRGLTNYGDRDFRFTFAALSQKQWGFPARASKNR